MSVFDDFEICRSILENFPTGLCALDIEKRIWIWSAGAERITGHLRHDVIGHRCVDEPLLHCDQPGCEFCREDCPLARAIKAAQPTESIAFLHHKAGHEIPVRLRAIPVRNLHGSIIGAVEIFEDRDSAQLDPREDGLLTPACFDEVTGVSGQAMMHALLRRAVAAFRDAQIPFAVLCLRVEGLDRFRSSFGPEAASSLLRVFAHSLSVALWKTDFLGRWADDEFLIILNGCREDALSSVRERLRRMLANDAIQWWGERRSLPISIGQSIAQAGDSIELLMSRARTSLDAASAARPRATAAHPSTGS